MALPGPGGVFFLAFTAVLASMPVWMFFAPRLGLIDRPDLRKLHRGEVPVVGGLALLTALVLVLGVWFSSHLQVPMMLIAGALVALAGMVDDRQGLSAAKRFIVQAIASALMIFLAGVSLHDFGELLWPGTLQLGWLGIPVTLFCVVGVTNSVNMIDGMDGLSASVSLVTLAGLIAAMLHAGQSLEAAPALVALTGALCGFLLYNFPLPWRDRAMVFLGDSGTLLLGFLLAWLLVDGSQGSTRLVAPVTALWLLAIPLMDTVFVMIKRRLAGVSMVEADREHLHHAFLHSGRSVRQTLVAMTLAAAVMAATGLLLEWRGVPEYGSYALFLGVSGVYFLIMSRAWRQRRFLGKVIE